MSLFRHPRWWHLKWQKQQRINTMRPRQNGRLFADDTFERIFLNENIRISTKNSLKFVPKGLINNIPALVLIMAWRRPGDKPLSEPMMVRLPTHICVTRPQWVKVEFPDSKFHGTNMGPTWVLSAPDGPQVGPIKLAIRGPQLPPTHLCKTRSVNYENFIPQIVTQQGSPQTKRSSCNKYCCGIELIDGEDFPNFKSAMRPCKFQRIR